MSVSVSQQPYSLPFSSHHHHHDDQRLHLQPRIHASNGHDDVQWGSSFSSSILEAPCVQTQSQHSYVATGLEYPSPPASLSSTSSIAQPHSHSASNDPNSSLHLPLESHQVSSSIGPSRVTTRGQRRALEASSQHRPAPYDPLGSPNQLARKNRRLSHPHLSASNSASRSSTPINVLHPSIPSYHQQHRHISLDMSDMGSPAHFSSLRRHHTLNHDSPYPHDSRHAHSPANSLTHSHPRSASPALSIATSTSSNSAPHPQAIPSSPQVLASAGPLRTKHRKMRLFNVDRKDICRYQQDNPGARQEDIAARFGVERSTISKILKSKSKWLNVPTEEEMRIARHRPSKFPDIEEQMVNWLVDNIDSRPNLSDNVIRNKAREIARALGFPDDKFKASSGWVENFKHRHGIRGGAWHGDGTNTGAARATGAGWAPVEAESPVASEPLHSSHRNIHEAPQEHQQHNSGDPGPSSQHQTVDTQGDYHTVWSGPPTGYHHHTRDDSHRVDDSSRSHSSHVSHGNVQTEQDLIIDSSHPSINQHGTLLPQQVSDTYAPQYYQQLPLPSQTAPMTIARADDELTRLLEFFEKGAGAGVLTGTEIENLRSVKLATFQAVSLL